MNTVEPQSPKDLRRSSNKPSFSQWRAEQLAKEALEGVHKKRPFPVWSSDKAPLPENFALSSHDIQQLEERRSRALDNAPGISWIDSLFPNEVGCLAQILLAVVFWTILWPFFLIGLFVSPVIQWFRWLSLDISPSYKRYLAFKDAARQFQKAVREYRITKGAVWQELSGLDFEYAIADLYRRQGYEASVTRASGDHGVDIELRLHGEYLVVQCKQHSRPVGPAVVRELYGAMHYHRADGAILVCTGGFTKGVHDFVEGTPIELVGIDEIVIMEEQLNTCLSVQNP